MRAEFKKKDFNNDIEYWIILAFLLLGSMLSTAVYMTYQETAFVYLSSILLLFFVNNFFGYGYLISLLSTVIEEIISFFEIVIDKVVSFFYIVFEFLGAIVRYGFLIFILYLIIRLLANFY